MAATSTGAGAGTSPAIAITDTTTSAATTTDACATTDPTATKEGQAEAKATTATQEVTADVPKEKDEQPVVLSAEDQLLARARRNVVTSKAFTVGKFELNKAKIIKFRNNSFLDGENGDNNNNGSNNNNNNNKDAQDAATADGDAATAVTTAATTAGAPLAEQQEKQEKEKNARRQHLFGDESTIESFFRRLSWTADGSYLICPSALWHGDKTATGGETPKIAGTAAATNDAEGPSYATCLFARHGFDQPCRVLAGLEKPSVVVRPNPVLFKLPPGATVPMAGTGEEETEGPSTTTRLPYRSIFAVLTLDSVLIYDTHHTNPLCIARGLHYANLTDAVWSPDGLTLMVSSRDGYISILNFADGELGETYVPALEAAEAKIVQEKAVKLASRPIVPVPRAVNTAATPSAEATKAVSVTPNGSDVANQKAGRKRIVPTLLPVGDSGKETDAMVTDATDKVEESTGSATADMTTGTAEATAAEPNILQPKKKKKRVQPVLVSCD